MLSADIRFNNINLLLKRIILFLVILLFVFMILIAPAAVSIAHTDHDHENTIVCRNTGMPECRCDDNMPVIENTIYEETRVFQNLRHCIEITDDCYICDLANKAINQQKLSYIAIRSTISTDSNLLITDHLFINHLQSTPLTPVESKTKLTN